MVKFGFHVSISGSVDKAVDRALEQDCDVFQMFTGNPRSWASRDFEEDEIEAFKEKKLKAGLDPVFGHMPYILNLASPDDIVYGRSIESLKVGMRRCRALGVSMLVTHIGSHLGQGPDLGVARVVGALNEAIKTEARITVLLENGSGSANKVGSSFEELQLILERISDVSRVAICLDTCHAFAAGYELRTIGGLASTIDSFVETIGLERLKLVHLNDSVGGLATGIDHHEHIGLGEIGTDGFRVILNSPLAEIPMIMETPIDERRGNADNMQIVRSLAGSWISTTPGNIPQY
ncbi:MAG: deoxyribonuclease IV [Candidatus Bathyarchaeota archaeon]|nr:MAG: deoxyribonuclease IV [Candidatus Bathyarchaeota archaeon]